MKSTRRTRQTARPVIRSVTPLAADDDLVRDILHDALAAIEPEDVSDLLDLADLALDVDRGAITLQTAVVA
ncbi:MULTISPECIES: hypothetical protein [unclassified Gordonia (in: high G+C Gram-positive bacteria)]|uniref:hypothetical protein n=1 Tax=unclassified Gordonia (in: high G+C Gram-positive bacteria) TaxID=2657482 RepID=UPI00071D8E1F|nr:MULTISPECIES: hypothetical protein [unclassified Gordonia (in: high G+C Gram-positive bacteria)]KSU59646.1 hypothetical protein AS181_06490 [Gordonia sp. SGD-V-85]SCC02621.1 hypothetical protein GA0061091_104205 [Gordonia sp. v-85]